MQQFGNLSVDTKVIKMISNAFQFPKWAHHTSRSVYSFELRTFTEDCSEFIATVSGVRYTQFENRYYTCKLSGSFLYVKILFALI
jgi:hypothetical protein